MPLLPFLWLPSELEPLADFALQSAYTFIPASEIERRNPRRIDAPAVIAARLAKGESFVLTHPDFFDAGYPLTSFSIGMRRERMLVEDYEGGPAICLLPTRVIRNRRLGRHITYGNLFTLGGRFIDGQTLPPEISTQLVRRHLCLARWLQLRSTKQYDVPLSKWVVWVSPGARLLLRAGVPVLRGERLHTLVVN